MTQNTISLILYFAISSYATGWCLVGYRAARKGIVDLCQFVRAFFFAPFITAIAMGLTLALGTIAIDVIVPNMLKFLAVMGTIVGVFAALWATGYFVVKPSVKKAYGIAKPFSEKICIVMYKR